MPKTTVNKNNNPLSSKSEIWFAEQRLVAPPPGDSIPFKNLDQAQLGSLVSSRANKRHYLRSLMLVPDDGH
jgi:hypothetical protein